MKITFFAIACLCCKHPPAFFAAADGKAKSASSLDSFESASRMEKVSITSNLTQQQQHHHHRKLLGVVGKDYLREIRAFTPPSETDQRFGDRVAASTNGRIVAITGSELVLVPGATAGDSVHHWRGYVEIHNLDTNTRVYIRSDTSEYEPPKLDVALNGDGTKAAVAEVHIVSTEDDGGTSSATLNPISSVKVYKLDEESEEEGSSSWSMVGSHIPIGIAGKLPGLRLAFNDSGETLVVGSRNYNNGIGRTVVYQLNSDGDGYNERVVVNGQNKDDHEGSSVSITSDGAYYASGATGFEAIGPGEEATVKDNRGGVRIFSFDTNEQVGNVILGEEEGDASGFSVSLVKMTPTKLVVAIGAIFNDPSADKLNAGHVRVYTYTIGGDDSNMNWQRVGGDIDGENGTYLDFDANMFHISDQFGFASQLSIDAKRLAIGAPYHFGPGSRDGGYYHGKVKLFEFSDNGEWVQIASDIVGASKDSNTGHSLAIDTTGKTIVVGGPSETGGSVLVYYQDEYSSQPSTGPSLGPSAAPSHVPTVFHSSSPSNSPSLTPSMQPSIIPSQVPSQNPSTFEERTFQILSTSPEFSNLAGNGVGDQTWCLEAKLSAADPSSSILKVRPCSESRAGVQLWFLQDGKLSLRNENPGTFCVKDEMRTLSLQSCDKVLDTSSISFTSKDETVSGAIVLSRNGKQLYFTVSNTKIFSRVRLSTKQAVNSSREAWQINYVASPVNSLAPSPVPSPVNSLAPSPVPSPVNSLAPSPVPSIVPVVVQENIALLGSATALQSSSYRVTTPASKAIDGNTNGNYYFVSHTDLEESPSWHVTWPAAHRIFKIKVWNRTDSGFGNRIIGFVLNIYLNDHIMWSSTESAVDTLSYEETYDFHDIPSHIVGDKVEVQLPGKEDYLQLAEVEVFGYSNELYNVARNKDTAQSSNYGNNAGKYGSQKVVDGDVRPESEAGRNNNIGFTRWDRNPFWYVLLGSPVVIETIVIYNRDLVGCGGCSSLLRGFRMEILNVVDGNESVVHTYDDTSGPDPGLVISLDMPAGIVGNKVRISIPGRTENLHLREVQVFSSV